MNNLEICYDLSDEEKKQILKVKKTSTIFSSGFDETNVTVSFNAKTIYKKANDFREIVDIYNRIINVYCCNENIPKISCTDSMLKVSYKTNYFYSKDRIINDLYGEFKKFLECFAKLSLNLNNNNPDLFTVEHIGSIFALIVYVLENNLYEYCEYKTEVPHSCLD